MYLDLDMRLKRTYVRVDLQRVDSYLWYDIKNTYTCVEESSRASEVCS